MEQIKQYIMKHFEKLLVALIFIVAFLGTYFIEEVSLIFNFYYLPVLIASYFLGRRIMCLSNRLIRLLQKKVLNHCCLALRRQDHN